MGFKPSQNFINFPNKAALFELLDELNAWICNIAKSRVAPNAVCSIDFARIFTAKTNRSCFTYNSVETVRAMKAIYKIFTEIGKLKCKYELKINGDFRYTKFCFKGITDDILAENKIATNRGNMFYFLLFATEDFIENNSAICRRHLLRSVVGKAPADLGIKTKIGIIKDFIQVSVENNMNHVVLTNRLDVCSSNYMEELKGYLEENLTVTIITFTQKPKTKTANAKLMNEIERLSRENRTQFFQGQQANAEVERPGRIM